MALRKPPTRSKRSKLKIHLQKRSTLSFLLLLLLVFSILYYIITKPSIFSTGYNTTEPFKRPPPQPGKFNWHARKAQYPITSHHALPSSPPSSSPSSPNTPLLPSKIQFPFQQIPPRKRTNTQATLKEQNRSRQKLIKSTFLHAWKSYRDYALTHDVLLPISGSSRNNHDGWGITMLSSLETLWLLGFVAEFEEVVGAVAKVDFSRSERGVVDVVEVAGVIGALLGAWEVSEGRYGVLLEKAVEVGDFVFGAFDTGNGMVVSRWDWKRTMEGKPQSAFDDMLLGELPALTTEFTRLTQLSGDPKFFDAVQRITNVLDKHQNKTKLPGLWPLTIDAKNERFDTHHAFTMGWMADGAYNYLAAQHLLLSGHTTQYQTLYNSAINTALNHTIYPAMLPTTSTPNEKEMLFSFLASVISPEGTPIVTKPDGQIQHLACYIPSLLALGSKVFSRPRDLEVARALAEGCIWGHDTFENGVMPEAFYVLPCDETSVRGEDGKRNCEWSEKRWLEGVMSMDESISAVNVREKVKEFGLPKGVIAVTDTRFTLRPQFIQSLFVLYRITGDQYYQDVAWRIFTSINAATRTKYGNAGLANGEKKDIMEPWWLGETLKWFYLIFGDERKVNLDEWTISGKGHLMRWSE